MGDPTVGDAVKFLLSLGGTGMMAVCLVLLYMGKLVPGSRLAEEKARYEADIARERAESEKWERIAMRALGTADTAMGNTNALASIAKEKVAP